MGTNLKEPPLISIVMTTYNRADMVDGAIKSVLSQTYDKWELLILDDASTDDTKSVVAQHAKKDPRIIYLPAPENLGITKNRNRAFPLATGEYIAVLDSDDLWTRPDKLQKQVEFLASHPDHVLVGSNVSVINENAEVVGHFKYEGQDQAIRARLLLRNQFTHSAVLWRRRPRAEELRYDETVPVWEDYDLILRLGQIGKLANLPEEMTAYRKHGGNISKSKKINGAHAHLNIIKRYKDNYPYYQLARLKGWLRLFV
jgi:glycosyltransferase involved in cell wall biosynthesis